MSLRLLTSLTIILSFFKLAEANENLELKDKLILQNSQLSSIIESNNRIIQDNSSAGSVSQSNETLVPNTSSNQLSSKYSMILNFSIPYHQRPFYLSESQEIEQLETQEQLALSLGYRLVDLVWIEGTVAQSRIDNFPYSGASTDFYSYALKLKYSYQLSEDYGIFLSPYLGYQVVSTKNNETFNEEEFEGALAKKALNELNTKRIIYGASIGKSIYKNLKMNIDIGTDWFAAGVGIYL